jgi:hypothetical protein
VPYSADVPACGSPLRFTVGTDRGPRSAVWRVWSQGDETYVAPRGATNAKASLHSGSHFYHGPQRHYRWARPEPLGPGATDLYDIWIPTPELTDYETEPTDAEKAEVVLVPAAPAVSTTVVSIVQTDETVDLGPPADTPSGLMAHWLLRGGAQIWVVATYQPYLDEHRQFVERGKAEGWEVEGPGFAEFVEANDHVRMMCWVREDDGRYGIADVSPHRSEPEA